MPLRCTAFVMNGWRRDGPQGQPSFGWAFSGSVLVRAESIVPGRYPLYQRKEIVCPFPLRSSHDDHLSCAQMTLTLTIQCAKSIIVRRPLPATNADPSVEPCPRQSASYPSCSRLNYTPSHKPSSTGSSLLHQDRAPSSLRS